MKRLKEKRLRTQLFIAASARSSCLLLLLLRSLALIIPDRLRAALQGCKQVDKAMTMSFDQQWS